MTDEEGQTSEVNFYPRPPRGGRQALALKTAAGQEFLSTPSARRATFLELSFPKAIKHFYPRPPRGGRRFFGCLWPGDVTFLSTPSARRATPPCPLGRGVYCYFYPRPPRGGRLPALLRDVAAPTDFYPRPPRGGRPERLHSTAFDRTISIHALREEGDAQKQLDATAKGLFLSTPSARRATPAPACRAHAP